MTTSGSVLWYRRWHGEFLYRALKRELAGRQETVVYAQGTVEASAALRARRGPHQRVIMATQYCSSQADAWVSKKQIKPDGRVYRDTAIVEIRA